MPIVKLPKQAVTRFDLPQVCLTTGATDGVGYHKTTFQFVPMWARLSVALCGLIGVILMLVSTKRAEVEIPMTAEAHASWKKHKVLVVVLLLAAVAVLIVPMVIDEDLIFVGIVAGAAGFVGAIVYALTVVKNAGPVCKEIDETHVTLEIPSEAAAAAIQQRLGGGSSAHVAPAAAAPA